MTAIIEAIHIDSGKAVGGKGSEYNEVMTALDDSILRADLTGEQINDLFKAADLGLAMASVVGASEGKAHGWIVRWRLLP